jgi:hypothetical protein
MQGRMTFHYLEERCTRVRNIFLHYEEIQHTYNKQRALLHKYEINGMCMANVLFLLPSYSLLLISYLIYQKWAITNREVHDIKINLIEYESLTA